MRVIIFRFLPIVFFCCALNCVTQPESITVKVDGYVLDINTNAPVGNIQVKLYQEISSGNFLGSPTYNLIKEVKSNAVGYYTLQFTINKSEYYKICAFGPKDDNLIMYGGGDCKEYSYDWAKAVPNRNDTFHIDNGNKN